MDRTWRCFWSYEFFKSAHVVSHGVAYRAQPIEEAGIIRGEHLLEQEIVQLARVANDVM